MDCDWRNLTKFVSFRTSLKAKKVIIYVYFLIITLSFLISQVIKPASATSLQTVGLNKKSINQSINQSIHQSINLNFDQNLRKFFRFGRNFPVIFKSIDGLFFSKVKQRI